MERRKKGVGDGGIVTKLGSAVNQVLGNVTKKVAVRSVMDLDDSSVGDRDGRGHRRRDSATGWSTCNAEKWVRMSSGVKQRDKRTTSQDRVVKRKTPTKELSVGKGISVTRRKIALVSSWGVGRAPDFGVLAASDGSDEDSQSGNDGRNSHVWLIRGRKECGGVLRDGRLRREKRMESEKTRWVFQGDCPSFIVNRVRAACFRASVKKCDVAMEAPLMPLSLT